LLTDTYKKIIIVFLQKNNWKNNLQKIFIRAF